MGFEYLNWITLLVVGSAMFLVLWLLRRWLKLQQRADQGFTRRLKNYSLFRGMRVIGIGILGLAAILMGLAVLGPLYGEKITRGERLGVDVMVVLDVSKSMMAEDLSERGEVQDRLSVAKEMIGEYVRAHPENRYGLVVFAGEAFASSPLTFDSQAYLTFLEGVSYQDVGKQGTNLIEEVQMGVARLVAHEEKRGKLMALVSDGGDDETGHLNQMAATAVSEGVKVVTVGIGNEKGVPIPEGKDMFGRSVYKEYQGAQVLTKLNEAPLQELAQATGGRYIHAERASDFTQLDGVLAKVEKSGLQVTEASTQENRYQWFLGIALLLLLGYLGSELEPISKPPFYCKEPVVGKKAFVSP